MSYSVCLYIVIPVNFISSFALFIIIQSVKRFKRLYKNTICGKIYVDHSTRIFNDKL